MHRCHSLLASVVTLLVAALAAACASAAAPERDRTVGADDAGQRAAPLAASVQRELDVWRREAVVPGAVIAVTDGTRVLSRASGVARKAPRRAMRASDRLRIASASKTMVAAAAMQLVQAGDLRPGEPISRWFPELPEAGSITVRMLLNHTSGIPDYTGSAAYQALGDGPDQQWGHEQSIAAAASMSRPFAPGARYEYSNTNYHALGLIIEAVTGERLFDRMRTRLFAPLGLDGIRFDDGSGAHAATARGYDEDGRDLHTTAYAPGSAWRTAGWADGGGIMTATELARWGHALLGTTRVLDAATLRTMTRPALTSASGNANGLGIFGDDPVRAGRYTALGHDGGDLGYESLVIYYPDLRVAVAVLVNGIVDEDGVVMQDLARSSAVRARRAWAANASDAADSFAGDSIH